MTDAPIAPTPKKQRATSLSELASYLAPGPLAPYTEDGAANDQWRWFVDTDHGRGDRMARRIERALQTAHADGRVWRGCGSSAVARRNFVA